MYSSIVPRVVVADMMCLVEDDYVTPSDVLRAGHQAPQSAQPWTAVLNSHWHTSKPA